MTTVPTDALRCPLTGDGRGINEATYMRMNPLFRAVLAATSPLGIGDPVLTDLERHAREEVESAKRWERKLALADEKTKRHGVATSDVKRAMEEAPLHLCMQITAALNADDLTYAGGLLRDVVLHYLAEQEEDE